MSPKACRVRHVFCVEVTPAPMLIPVRLPANPPFAAPRKKNRLIINISFSKEKRTELQLLTFRSQELTDGLRDAEGQPNGRIGEGHDGGDDGQPPNLIKVRYLREEDLNSSEEDHVGVAGALAWVGVPMFVKAPRPPNRPHADARRDGVADGDADEVGVLDHSAEGHPDAAEVGPDGVHVRVVPLPGLRVARAVALCEQRGRVVGDEGEEEHRGGAGHPAELRDGPGQGEHAGPDDGGDDVGARRPHRPRAQGPAVVVEPVDLAGVPGLHGHLHRRHVLHAAVLCRHGSEGVQKMRLQQCRRRLACVRLGCKFPGARRAVRDGDSEPASCGKRCWVWDGGEGGRPYI
jgi:hypothetical protein